MAKPVIVTLGSENERSLSEPWRAQIQLGIDQGLTEKRIHQDLRDEHGFDYQRRQRCTYAQAGRWLALPPTRRPEQGEFYPIGDHLWTGCSGHF